MWSELNLHSNYLCPAGTSSGGGGSTDWTPPQCWWGPEFDPQGLASDIGQLGVGSSTSETYTALNGVYAANGPQGAAPTGYKSTDGPPFYMYNIGAGPAGEWWGLIWNEDITLQGINDCTAIEDNHFPKTDWYWVANQAAPPEPGDAPTLDSHQLALYVAGKIDLQPLPIQTSPSLATTKATVGLPTWVWANAADATVGDTICTDNAAIDPQICVTMKAQAKSFTLVSSDPGATLYTNCNLNTDGTVGTAYTDQSGDPPCGVTFSQPGAWTLSMVTTWAVTITYDGGQLTQNTNTETDMDATVQEVQAINN
jgi:hypothetical protein